MKYYQNNDIISFYLEKNIAIVGKDINQMEKKVNRREFLQEGSKVAVGAGLMIGAINTGLLTDAATDENEVKEKKEAQKPDVTYRVLGKTKQKIRTVSIGAMNLKNPAIVRYAIDQGVNYIDTARAYTGGKNEAIVGKAIKGIKRDKIFIATKFHQYDSYDSIMKSAETSLKELGIDYIDLLQVHNVKDKEPVSKDYILKALEKLKQDGKIKFCGVTTHQNEPEVIDATIETKFYDAVLVKINFQSPKEVIDAAKRAYEAKLGVIAMKTQAKGGYDTKELGDITPHQAALKWVLQHEFITTAIPGVTTFEAVDEDLAVIGMKLTRLDRKSLHRYSQKIDKTYCRMCGGCSGTCRYGVDIAENMRALMYAEGYGDLELGKETFYQLPITAKATVCSSCDSCTAKCVNGLKIAARLQKANEMLA